MLYAQQSPTGLVKQQASSCYDLQPSARHYRWPVVQSALNDGDDKPTGELVKDSSCSGRSSELVDNNSFELVASRRMGG